jgi:hypothetical protein
MHSTNCGSVIVSLLGDVFGLPIRVVETARHDDPKEGSNVIDEGGRVTFQKSVCSMTPLLQWAAATGASWSRQSRVGRA